MKKIIFAFLTLMTFTAAADDFRYPQVGLPALNVNIRRFIDDKESIIYAGALELQILCTDGRKFVHKFKSKGQVVDEKICQYEPADWDPKTGALTLHWGVPDMSKVNSPCTIGRTVTLTVKLLEEIYCSAR